MSIIGRRQGDRRRQGDIPILQNIHNWEWPLFRCRFFPAFFRVGHAAILADSLAREQWDRMVTTMRR
jgi:hypothetical protein